MTAFIGRSALASFLLEVAQLDEPGLRGLALDDAQPSWTSCSWRVATVDHGTADPSKAKAAVAAAVRGNSAWIMVDDGDPRDGQAVSDYDSGIAHAERLERSS